LGLLIDPMQVGPEDCAEYVTNHLPAQVDVALHSLVDGEPRKGRSLP
jgi:hypothetical protein